MDKTQVGRAGELAFALHLLVTADGLLELFTPVADDDHVDLVVGRQGGVPSLAIQIKTTPGLDKDGLVECRASYPAGQVREDSAFWYAILLLEGVVLRHSWLVPSPEFNRLVYRYQLPRREELEFRASPEATDAFAPFRTAPLGLGPAILEFIDRSTVGQPAWLAQLGALQPA